MVARRSNDGWEKAGLWHFHSEYVDMRPATAAAIVFVLAALGGAVVVAVTGGFAGADAAGSLSVTWTSDTQVPSDNNHHEVAVGDVGGESRVFVPLSSTQADDTCALIALDGRNGSEQWRDRVPTANCTVHAVADPAIVDYDLDGTNEVLATTTERVVRAYSPSGDIERTWSLSAYGYTKPLVADVTGDAALEVVVVDSRGLVQVLDADGTVAWRVDRAGYVWGNPSVRDLDGDDELEVVVAGSDGSITAYTADGDTHWNTSLDGTAVTWMTTDGGDGSDSGDGTDSGDGSDSGDGTKCMDCRFYLGTPTGSVFAVDATGDIVWTRSLPDLTATGAVLTDETGTGVFVTAADGAVRRLDAATGETMWRTAVANDAVQMMPPPVASDVTGDGQSEVVVAAHDGTLAVVDPADGSTIASSTHDGTVFATPVAVDVDDDPQDEVFVLYADGTVRRFDYDPAD